MEKSIRDIIKVYLIQMLIAFGIDVKDEKLLPVIKVYLDRLEKYDHEMVCRSMTMLIDTWKPAYGQKYPALGDILEPLHKRIEAEQEAEIDEKWNSFKVKGISPDSRLPDWAYTIKKYIGIGRINGMRQESDMIWLEKDFRSLCKRVLNGEIELQGDPRAWKKYGNVWGLMPHNSSSSSNGFVSIGDIAKNAQKQIKGELDENN